MDEDTTKKSNDESQTTNDEAQESFDVSPSTENEEETTKEVIKEVEVEVNVDYKDKWMRAQADYQNLQKEIAQKRSQWVKMSEVQVLEAFIPVYDNFKKAAAHTPEEGGNWNAWAQGISFIQKQFGDILNQFNVEEIKTVGEKFDIELHEAAGEEESDKESGTILKEVDAGYKANGKIIKPAKVIVAK